LAELCDGRLLPVFGLGTAEEKEHSAFNVARRDRGPWFDEAFPVIRRLLDGESVSAGGRFIDLVDVCVTDGRPAPVRDLWMGGRSGVELRRVARHADGWLASFASPRETRQSIELIAKQAAEVGRQIDDDHYGLLFPYARHRRPDAMTELLRRAYPSEDPNEICPVGVTGLRSLFDQQTDAGVTKYILVPAERPDDWGRELESIRAEVAEATSQSTVVTLGW
jgi:probable F420-dependent oxidoreductase